MKHDQDPEVMTDVEGTEEPVVIPLVGGEDSDDTLVTDEIPAEGVDTVEGMTPEQAMENQRRLGELIGKLSASMVLEADRDGIEIIQVLDRRMREIDINENLDENRKKTCRHCLNIAFKSAQNMPKPSTEPTPEKQQSAKMALTMMAAGSRNTFDPAQAGSLRRRRKPGSKVSDKEKKRRRKNNKAASKTRKRNKRRK